MKGYTDPCRLGVYYTLFDPESLPVLSITTNCGATVPDSQQHQHVTEEAQFTKTSLSPQQELDGANEHNELQMP